MRLFEIIKKEVSLIRSQRIAVLLIVLYPLLAISLLGFGLTGYSIETISSARIGIFNNLPYELNIQKEIFGEKSNTTIVDYYDTNSLILGVKKKEVVVGLELKALSKESEIIVDLYYDNSNIAAGSTFKEFAKITMNSFALKQTRSQLDKIWIILSGLGEDIGSEIDQIEDFKQKLISAETTLENLEEKTL